MKSDDQPIPEQAKASLRERARIALNNRQFEATSSMLDLYELELFSWYVKETEITVDTMRSNSLAHIAEQCDAGREPVNDSAMVAVEYFLKRLRYSHIIYLTSILETFLEGWCEKLTTLLGPENVLFTIKDLKGDQWSVKRKFLEKYGKFVIAADLWSGIHTLTCLRNNLVHDNGATTELNPDDKKTLAKQRGIVLSGNEVVIQPEYIDDAVQLVERVVRLVDSELAKLIERAVRPTVVEP